MALRIIATGGTFDKSYDPIGGVLGFEDSHLPEIIDTLRLIEPPVLEIVALVDSLDMENDQRKAVLEACRRSPEDRIVVIHGTDTMAVTAALVGEAGLEKSVVFTGAMVPYAVRGSDAVFNLGCAVMATGLLENGTWVAMNGRILPWHSVRKDVARGLFVRTEASG